MHVCEVFYEDGTRIPLGDDNSKDFCNQSTNWECIYDYGNGIIYRN
jgi:hypothetical protein